MQRIGAGMNIWWIDFDRLEVYEAGALLVTLLAYPEEGEETRSEVHASLCAHALRVKVQWSPIGRFRRNRSSRSMRCAVRMRTIAFCAPWNAGYAIAWSPGAWRSGFSKSR